MKRVFKYVTIVVGRTKNFRWVLLPTPLFNKKGIFSVEDLIRFFPRAYNDCSNITGILPENAVSIIIVRINDVRLYNNGTPVIVATCTEKNSGKRVNISWFHQNYLYSRICYLRNSEVLVSGKVTYNMQYGNYSLSSPLVFTSDIKNGARIYPVYSKINGMRLSLIYLIKYLK